MVVCASLDILAFGVYCCSLCGFFGSNIGWAGRVVWISSLRVWVLRLCFGFSCWVWWLGGSGFAVALRVRFAGRVVGCCSWWLVLRLAFGDLVVGCGL